MKGFVPVSKESLLTMAENSLIVIESDFTRTYQERIDKYIEQEKRRISEKKWYRLWTLPKARFDLNDIESVVSYSANRSYDIFEGCPFEFLKEDRDNSIKWVEDIISIASSSYAGEPIQITVEDFKRLSNPDKYVWVSISIMYTIRRR